MHIEMTCYDDVMEKNFRTRKELGLTEARSKEEFFGFGYTDIAEVHFHKQGTGAGVYFRLRDGRVFDTAAWAHDPDPSLYDQTTH